MTIDEVADRLLKIWESRGDPEISHIADDKLRSDVLKHIADGGEHAVTMANMVLSTDNMGLSKRYA